MTAAAPTLTVATWNLERQAPDRPRAGVMLSRLAALQPHLLCLTEAHVHSTRDLGGHAVSTPGVSWSKAAETERKVVLWSRHPWREIDERGAPGCETGAFVQAVTETPLGLIRVIGVCIPYHFASPLGLTPKAKPWSQHLRFLEGLATVVDARDGATPCMLLGDFNQVIPCIWGPKAAASALIGALGDLAVVTKGPLPNINKPAIDHIAHCARMRATRVWGLSDRGDQGERLSDHFGVAAAIERA